MAKTANLNKNENNVIKISSQLIPDPGYRGLPLRAAHPHIIMQGKCHRLTHFLLWLVKGDLE